MPGNNKSGGFSAPDPVVSVSENLGQRLPFSCHIVIPFLAFLLSGLHRPRNGSLLVTKIHPSDFLNFPLDISWQVLKVFLRRPESLFLRKRFQEHVPPPRAAQKKAPHFHGAQNQPSLGGASGGASSVSSIGASAARAPSLAAASASASAAAFDSRIASAS